MDKLEQIIAFSGSAITLLAALLTFVIKFTKSAKAKLKAEQALKLMEIVQPLIVEAEKFVNFSGKEKKQFVLTNVNQFAIEHNFRYSAEVVSKLVDDILLTTKSVNARDKDIKVELVKNEILL